MGDISTCFDADDYLKLTYDQRIQLDEWLSSLGGFPTITQKIFLENGYVIAFEYSLDGRGQHRYDRKKKEVMTRERRYIMKTPPPVWKE